MQDEKYLAESETKGERLRGSVLELAIDENEIIFYRADSQTNYHGFGAQSPLQSR